MPVQALGHRAHAAGAQYPFSTLGCRISQPAAALCLLLCSLTHKDFYVKKTYLLRIEGKNTERLLEAAKHDIRKYLKRERAKDLPKGVDFWDFDCQVGTDADQTQAVHTAALMTQIDSLVQNGAAQFYVEVLAKPGVRSHKPRAEGQDDAYGHDEEMNG